MIASDTLNIINETKGKLPRLPFLDVKNAVLGKKYDLSIAFVSRAKSRKINKQFRDKDYATNILSFELSDTSGELIINLDCVKRDAPQFEKSYPKFLGFLVIHGMLHLKGMAHGSIMEKLENKFSKKFGF